MRKPHQALNQRAALGFYSGLMGLALLSACSPTDGLLMPTPANFVAPQDRTPVNSAQTIYTSNDLNLLYVTDRAPIADPQTNALSYGSERSRTMSFGSIDIRIESDSSEAMGEMKLGGIKEIGRFPEVPYSAVDRFRRLSPRACRRGRARRGGCLASRRNSQPLGED